MLYWPVPTSGRDSCRNKVATTGSLTNLTHEGPRECKHTIETTRVRPAGWNERCRHEMVGSHHRVPEVVRRPDEAAPHGVPLHLPRRAG